MQDKPPQDHRRPIRSFVVRSGRLTPSQQQALDDWWPVYGLDDTRSPLDAEAVFGRRAPLVFEIGFGMGDSLAEQAERHPEKDFIGVEVHRPGVGKLLREIHQRGLNNLRIYSHDATEILHHCIAENSLDTIQIFFPDPWHKKRHHKRRLIQAAFVDHLTDRLLEGGRLHLATDWQNYAEHMMELLSANSRLVNTAGPGVYATNTDRPVTKFQRRGLRLGHGVWDLLFEKQSAR